VTTRAHLTALAFILLAGVFVVRLFRSGSLRSKYALLWLAVAGLLVPLAVFPGLLSAYSDLVGVHYPPTALLLTAVVILFFVAVHYSWELSRAERRLRRLAEEVALLLDAVGVARRPGVEQVSSETTPDDARR
jgi:hypothetical protein